ncbi:MAG: hypothetical protein ACT4QG_12290 [Sporichthyaceae bacterium]
MRRRSLLVAAALGAVSTCAASAPAVAAAPAEFVWKDKAGTTARINAANLGACQETKDGAYLANNTGKVVVIYTSPNCQGFGVPVPDSSELTTQFQSVRIPQGGVLGREG